MHNNVKVHAALFSSQKLPPHLCLCFFADQWACGAARCLCSVPSVCRARRMSAIHNSATNPVAQPPSNLSNTTMLMETGGAGGGPLLTTMPHSPDPNTNSSMGELGSSGTVGVPGANTGASPKRSYGAAGALGGLGSLGSQEAVGRGGTPRAASNAQYAAERTAAGAAEQVFQGILTMGVDILAQTHQANQQQRVGFMSRRRASKANAQVDGGLSKLRAITSFTQVMWATSGGCAGCA